MESKAIGDLFMEIFTVNSNVSFDFAMEMPIYDILRLNPFPQFSKEQIVFFQKTIKESPFGSSLFKLGYKYPFFSNILQIIINTNLKDIPNPEYMSAFIFNEFLSWLMIYEKSKDQKFLTLILQSLLKISMLKNQNIALSAFLLVCNLVFEDETISLEMDPEIIAIIRDFYFSSNELPPGSAEFVVNLIPRLIQQSPNKMSLTLKETLNIISYFGQTESSLLSTNIANIATFNIKPLILQLNSDAISCFSYILKWTSQHAFGTIFADLATSIFDYLEKENITFPWLSFCNINPSDDSFPNSEDTTNFLFDNDTFTNGINPKPIIHFPKMLTIDTFISSNLGAILIQILSIFDSFPEYVDTFLYSIFDNIHRRGSSQSISAFYIYAVYIYRTLLSSKKHPNLQAVSQFFLMPIFQTQIVYRESSHKAHRTHNKHRYNSETPKQELLIGSSDDIDIDSEPQKRRKSDLGNTEDKMKIKILNMIREICLECAINEGAFAFSSIMSLLKFSPLIFAETIFRILRKKEKIMPFCDDKKFQNTLAKLMIFFRNRELYDLKNENSDIRERLIIDDEFARQSILILSLSLCENSESAILLFQNPLFCTAIIQQIFELNLRQLLIKTCINYINSYKNYCDTLLDICTLHIEVAFVIFQKDPSKNLNLILDIFRIFQCFEPRANEKAQINVFNNNLIKYMDEYLSCDENSQKLFFGVIHLINFAGIFLSLTDESIGKLQSSVIPKIFGQARTSKLFASLMSLAMGHSEYSTFTQLKAVIQSNKSCIIERPIILIVMFQTFLHTRFLEDLLLFIISLCSTIKQNAVLCHKVEVDLYLVKLLHKLRISEGLKTSGANDIENSITTEQLHLLLKALQCITSYSSSPTVVKQYISLLSPISSSNGKILSKYEPIFTQFIYNLVSEEYARSDLSIQLGVTTYERRPVPLPKNFTITFHICIHTLNVNDIIPIVTFANTSVALKNFQIILIQSGGTDQISNPSMAFSSPPQNSKKSTNPSIDFESDISNNPIDQEFTESFDFVDEPPNSNELNENFGKSHFNSTTISAPQNTPTFRRKLSTINAMSPLLTPVTQSQLSIDEINEVPIMETLHPNIWYFIALTFDSTTVTPRIDIKNSKPVKINPLTSNSNVSKPNVISLTVGGSVYLMQSDIELCSLDIYHTLNDNDLSALFFNKKTFSDFSPIYHYNIQKTKHEMTSESGFSFSLIQLWKLDLIIPMFALFNLPFGDQPFWQDAPSISLSILSKALLSSLDVQISFGESNHFSKISHLLCKSSSSILTYNYYLQWYSLYHMLTLNSPPKSPQSSQDYNKMRDQLLCEILVNPEIWFNANDNEHIEIIHHWDSVLFESHLSDVARNFPFSKFLNLSLLYYWFTPNRVEYLHRPGTQNPRNPDFDIKTSRLYLSGILTKLAGYLFTNEDYVQLLAQCVWDDDNDLIESSINLLQQIFIECPQIFNNPNFHFNSTDASIMHLLIQKKNQNIPITIIEIILHLHRMNILPRNLLNDHIFSISQYLKAGNLGGQFFSRMNSQMTQNTPEILQICVWYALSHSIDSQKILLEYLADVDSKALQNTSPLWDFWLIQFIIHSGTTELQRKGIDFLINFSRNNWTQEFIKIGLISFYQDEKYDDIQALFLDEALNFVSKTPIAINQDSKKHSNIPAVHSSGKYVIKPEEFFKVAIEFLFVRIRKYSCCFLDPQMLDCLESLENIGILDLSSISQLKVKIVNNSNKPQKEIFKFDILKLMTIILQDDIPSFNLAFGIRLDKEGHWIDLHLAQLILDNFGTSILPTISSSDINSELNLQSVIVKYAQITLLFIAKFDIDVSSHNEKLVKMIHPLVADIMLHFVSKRPNPNNASMNVLNTLADSFLSTYPSTINNFTDIIKTWKDAIEKVFKSKNDLFMLKDKNPFLNSVISFKQSSEDFVQMKTDQEKNWSRLWSSLSIEKGPWDTSLIRDQHNSEYWMRDNAACFCFCPFKLKRNIHFINHTPYSLNSDVISPDENPNSLSPPNSLSSQNSLSPNSLSSQNSLSPNSPSSCLSSPNSLSLISPVDTPIESIESPPNDSINPRNQSLQNDDIFKVDDKKDKSFKTNATPELIAKYSGPIIHQKKKITSTLKKLVKFQADEDCIIICKCKVHHILKTKKAVFSLFKPKIELFFTESQKIHQIPLCDIRYIFSRTTLHRPNSIELFLSDGRSYFLEFRKLNITTLQLIGKIVPFCSNQTGGFLGHFGEVSLLPRQSLIMAQQLPFSQYFASLPLKSNWISGKLSNFEYLIYLNLLSGRTFHDLAQYPLFPWVITDFTSTTLDLRNHSVFRSLSTPMGALDGIRLDHLLGNYREMETMGETPYLYSSGPISSMGVCLYLLRLEPFSTAHVNFQSGHFDNPMRLISDIGSTWRLVSESAMEFWELTPEFYFQPEFLSNYNGFDLGSIGDDRLNDIKLPPWASSPIDFVYKNRKALESEYVSKHLQDWIDLIWGVNQRSISRYNVYMPTLYDDIWDVLSREKDQADIDVKIMQTESLLNLTGQIPTQLFREPHPPKSDEGDTWGHRNLITINADNNTPIIFLFGQKSNNVMKLKVIDLDGTASAYLVTEAGVHKKKTKEMPKVITALLASQNLFTLVLNDRTIMFGDKTGKEFFAYKTNSNDYRTIRNLHNSLVCACASNEWFATVGDESTVNVFSLANPDKPRYSFRSYRDSITCADISETFKVFVAGTRDGALLITSLTVGEIVRVIDLDSIFEKEFLIESIYTNKVIVTPSWGFIVTVADIKINGIVRSFILTFTINGDLVRKIEINTEVVMWTAFRSKKGFDYIAWCSKDDELLVFEAYYLNQINIAQSIQHPIMRLTYLQATEYLAVLDGSGKVKLIPFVPNDFTDI